MFHQTHNRWRLLHPHSLQMFLSACVELRRGLCVCCLLFLHVILSVCYVFGYETKASSQEFCTFMPWHLVYSPLNTRWSRELHWTHVHCWAAPVRFCSFLSATELPNSWSCDTGEFLRYLQSVFIMDETHVMLVFWCVTSCLRCSEFDASCSGIRQKWKLCW